MNDAVRPIGKKNPNLPFHPAVRAGDYIFVSGQVAKDESGNMCVGNIEEETRWTLETVRRVLKEAGLVDVEPRAQQRVYELRAKPLLQLHDWLERYRSVWDAKFEALDELLDELEGTKEKSDGRKR